MHNMMTMDAIADQLEKDFLEEIEDCNKYWEMSKSAKAMGCEELAEYLKEISKDEYTHAKFIHDWMEEHCITPKHETTSPAAGNVPMGHESATDEHTKWHALKERMEPYFC